MTEWTQGLYKAEDFRLENGGLLPQAHLAYVATGDLDAGGSNAILVTHGYTTGHHFVLPGSLAAEGSWSELIGPGRAIDTQRFFVVSINALGSCYGSSGPASTDPDTGQCYGERFPEITLEDTARLQHRLLRHLGVNSLHAVAGPSMGGLLALQWGVQFPDFVARLVVAVSGLTPPRRGLESCQLLMDQIRSQPGWNGGFSKQENILPWLVLRRMDALRTYSMDEYFRQQGLQEEQICERLRELATSWAKNFHPWSLVALASAIGKFDIEHQLHRMRAKILLALCANDQLFPASDGVKSVHRLRSADIDAKYFEIRSRFGHLASGLDWQLWQEPLRDFLD